MLYWMNAGSRYRLSTVLGAVLFCLACQPSPPVKPTASETEGGGPITPLPVETGVVSDEVQTLREAAMKLQSERKWCDAMEAWEKVKGRLADAPEQADLREEAEGNLRIAAKSCEMKPISDSVKVSPGEDRPEEVPEKDIVDFYPVGRTIRSISYINVTGSGTNTQWIVKGTSHFAYQYRIIVETQVVENRGTAVVFRQQFRDVTQLRAVSNQTLELNLPESPILGMIWKQFEDQALKPLPQYRLVKKLAELSGIVDPRLKQTLTRFQKLLKRYGASVDDSDEVELVVLLDRLAGCVVELEYVSGLGVTEIKLLEGNDFNPGDLERLAHNSGLLMDYFLSRSEKASAGTPFRVRSQDVGALIRFGYDVRVDGDIELTKDTAPEIDESSVLKLTGGEVTVRGTVEGIDHTGHLKPISGLVRYSPHDRLVREARAAWKADTSWITTDHLLFGTEKVRDLKLETYYEAQQVSIVDSAKAKP